MSSISIFYIGPYYVYIYHLVVMFVNVYYNLIRNVMFRMVVNHVVCARFMWPNSLSSQSLSSNNNKTFVYW